MDAEDYHFRFKITLVGDSGVGKTTFLDSLSQSYGKVLENESVEEVHFKSVIFIDETTLYRINYWDLPGSERYLPLISRYCAGSTTTVFMFDASRRASFERIEKWINEVEKTEVLTKVLIGNKADLMGTKKGATNVNKTEAVALARKYGMEYFEISSLQEQSLAQVFEHIFNSIVSNIPNPPDPGMLLGKGISLGKRLTNNPKFKTALFDTESKYD
jgi:small GTP-binding protein